MKKSIVLVGGGDIGRGNTTYTTKTIDEKIVKMAKKENPVFLFIGFASNHSDSYYDTIKKIYKNLGCSTFNLKKKNLQNNRNLALEKIDKADIIYIGGGDTIKLKEEIKEYQIEEKLKEAYNRGCIMVGYSAGAILLSKEGLSDSKIIRGESNKNVFIDGLNFIDLTIVPHYEEKTNKEKDLMNSSLKKYKEIYLISNNTALIIENNKLSVIKSDPNKNIYKMNYNNDYIKEIFS